MDQLFSDLQNKTNDTADASKTTKDSEKLLQKQQDSTEKLTALLEKSMSSLSCGPTCQKIKKTEELNQQYLNAQTNMKTAPIQLETSKKNYYVFTEGRPYYDNMLEEELKEKSKKLVGMLAENFKEEITNAKTMNSYYNTALTNSAYTKELYDVYLEKNKLVQNSIKNHHADVITNDRKTYYETEAIEELKSWYTLFWYLFFFTMLIFGLTLFFKSSLNFFVKIIIVFIAQAYPYYVDPIAQFIYGFFHSLWKSLPKNVYNDL